VLIPYKRHQEQPPTCTSRRTPASLTRASRISRHLCLNRHLAHRHSLKPSIHILLRLLRLLTRIILRRVLHRQARLGTRNVQVAVIIHRLLERVALPAKDVVAMSSRASDVHRVDERVGAVGGPERLVGEFAYVPHDLVHDLGQLGGVGRWACAAAGGAGALAICDVRLVVGRVEVLAVPAAGCVLVFWWIM
jgi:hypothetical protein